MMNLESTYNEESLRQIYALLEKHECTELVRMVLDVAKPRGLNSTTSFSRFSQFSSNSTESRVSALSTDYTPSLLSSNSSGLRPQRELFSDRSCLTPPTPGILRVPSTTSEGFTPTDTVPHISALFWDCDSQSIASSATKRSEPSANDGCWFCTFCYDHKPYSAKADWKKHEQRHHETGEDWPCPIRNCFQVFDREANFMKHCQRDHPDIPPPTDIRIRLLPRVVYGCGFDGCKAVLKGWNERCNHVADLHMKKEGRKRSDWKYSNTIHNLLRQDATRTAWKGLFSEFQSKKPRYQITWKPENTRVLKQKLECSDMRPAVDVILHTALSLREDRPFNDVVELDPGFRTPSQDSIPHFGALTADQLSHILRSTPTMSLPGQLNIWKPQAFVQYTNQVASFIEPHPGTLVELDTQVHAGPNARIMNIMDIDHESQALIDDPEPQIPPGLDLDPSRMELGLTPRSIETHCPQPADPLYMSQHQRRLSRGHIFPKSIRHFASRKS